MTIQTKLCMILGSEPHSLLAKTSSLSPASCEHRGHYCVSNTITFTLLSPSPSSPPSPESCHHQHHPLHPFITHIIIITIPWHHHLYCIINTITFILLSPPSASPTPSALSYYHHHHQHDHVTVNVHHDHVIINTITFIPSSPTSPSPSSPSPSSYYCHQHHHHQHHHHHPRGSESPWQLTRAFSTDLKGLFSSSLHPRRTVIWRMFSSGRWSLLGGLKTRESDDRMSLWDSL